MPNLWTLFSENRYNLTCRVILLILAEVILLPYQSQLNCREVCLAAVVVASWAELRRYQFLTAASQPLGILLNFQM